jgi:hypothetical protein
MKIDRLIGILSILLQKEMIRFDYYSPGGETKREIEPEPVRDKLYQIACDMVAKYGKAVNQSHA